MKNFDWLVYTYRHRRAFVYVVEKLIKDDEYKAKMLHRAKYHDMDKMLMYLFLDQNDSQLRHVKVKSHHVESGLCNSYEDLLEMVIDYECSPYTKPDKPLNAYDFVNKLVDMNYMEQEFADKLFEIMHTLGIDYSYLVGEKAKELPFMTEEVTEEKILLEVFDYVSENPENEINYIKEQLKNIQAI